MAASNLVEEVQSSSVVARVLAEKEVRDSSRVEWEERPNITMRRFRRRRRCLWRWRGSVEAEAATLEEVAEIMKVTPVGEGKDPTMLEKINRVAAVIKQLDMVR